MLERLSSSYVPPNKEKKEKIFLLSQYLLEQEKYNLMLILKKYFVYPINTPIASSKSVIKTTRMFTPIAGSSCSKLL